MKTAWMILILISGESGWVWAKNSKHVPPPKTKALDFNCPYEAESSDANAFLEGVKANLDGAITNLKNKKEKCALDVSTIQAQLTSFGTAIDDLKKNQYPPNRDFGGLLRVGDASFSCSGKLKSLYQFLTDYTSERLKELDGGIDRDSGISGNLGEKVEDAIQKCRNSNTSRPNDQVAGCVYLELKFDPSAETNPTSPIDTAYQSSCVDGVVGGTKGNLDQARTDLEKKQKVFAYGMENLTVASRSLMEQIAKGDGEACQEIKNSVNSVVQTGLNVAGTLAGPWGAIGANVFSPLLTAAVNLIGSHEGEMKRLKKAKSALDDDDQIKLMKKFSCNVFQANKLNCEFLSRARYSFNSNLTCPAPGLHAENSIKTVMKLSEALQLKPDPIPEEDGQKTQNQKKVPQSITPSSATELYHKLFKEPLKTQDGKDVSLYDYLFNGFSKTEKNNSLPVGIFTRVLNDAPVTDGDYQLVKIKDKINDLHSNIQSFKVEGDKFSKAGSSERSSLKFTNGYNVVQDIQSGEFTEAITKYLDLAESNTDDQDWITSALAKDLKAQNANQSLETLNPSIPTNVDESADLTKKLGKFYKGFLTDENQIREKYILKPALNNIDRMKADFKRNSHIDHDGLKDAYTVFLKYLYPMFRDCLMNYQAAVVDDHQRLDKDYQASCGFLKGCKGKNNSIGIPFELDGSPQGNLDANNADDFKACGIVSQYNLISKRFQDEVLKKNTICGVRLDQALLGD